MELAGITNLMLGAWKNERRIYDLYFIGFEWI